MTQPELAAIARYNQATGILEDCLDGARLPGGEELFISCAAEYGPGDALNYIKVHFGWLREWHDAIDTLDADLRDGAGHLSNTADRLLTYEARAFLVVRDQVRTAALCHLVGDAGPWPVMEQDVFPTSNGYISI